MANVWIKNLGLSDNVFAAEPSDAQVAVLTMRMTNDLVLNMRVVSWPLYSASH